MKPLIALGLAVVVRVVTDIVIETRRTWRELKQEARILRD